jgi:cyclomaltodextrinase
MRHSILLCLLILAVGCVTSDVTDHHSSNRAPHALPWLPITLNPDTTLVPVRDYLLPTEELERVEWEDGSVIEVMDGNMILTQQPNRGMGFLSLWTNGSARQVPIFRSRLVKVEYELGPFYMAVESPKIKGSFTGWSPLPLDGPEGRMTRVFYLPPGRHAYQVEMNGEWKAEPGKPAEPNGFGAFNSILEVPENGDAPALSVEHHWATEFTNDLEFKATPGALVYGWWENHLFAVTEVDSTGEGTLRVPAAAYDQKRTHLRIWVANEQGVSASSLIPLEFGKPIENPGLLTRDDRQAMIMYFLMIDRFSNGDESNDQPVADPRIHPRANHQGGDFAGIQSAIKSGYFESLGVNTVWVSPIVTNPDSAFGWWSDPATDVTSAFSGYHGYWPIRSTETDRRFGSLEEFTHLVDEAHDHHLNVLVDYVANHVHQEHPAYQQHPEWATSLHLPDGRENTQLWDEQRLTTWFDTFMPTLDFSKPEVVEAMTDSAVWWIANTEIDGFRHDATKHIPEDFWRVLTSKIRIQTQDERNVFQIGETYGNPQLINSYRSNGMLDAQFDFNLYDDMVVAFAQDDATFDGLIEEGRQSLDTYGAHHLMGNITGNQDRPRFTSLAEGAVAMDEDAKFAGWTRNIQHQGEDGHAKMQLLMSYLFSIPGVPCIYYGDEFADVGGNDPDNRKMMRFTGLSEKERETRSQVADWARLRTSRMSMMYGSTDYEEVAPGCLQITRRYLGEETRILINKTPTDLPLPHGPDWSEWELLFGANSLDNRSIPARSAVALGL